MDTSKGVSLVLVNSKKGEKVWNEIKPRLVFRQSTLEAAAKHNPNVIRPTKEPEFRRDFFRILAKDGYTKWQALVLPVLTICVINA